MSTSVVVINEQIFIDGPIISKFARFSDVATALIRLQAKETLNTAYFDDFNIVQLILLHSAALTQQADLAATIELIATLINSKHDEIIKHISEISKPFANVVRYISGLIEFLYTLPDLSRAKLAGHLIAKINTISTIGLSSVQKTAITQTKNELEAMLPIPTIEQPASSPLSDSGLFPTFRAVP